MSGVVLVVDDDAAMQRAVRRHLTVRGYDVRVAESAEAGLMDLLNEPVDVLLADLHLGGPTGLDLIQAVSHLGFRTPCILMSARPAPVDFDRARALWVFRVLSKPFPSEELERVVRGAFEARATGHPDQAREQVLCLRAQLRGSRVDLERYLDAQRPRSNGDAGPRSGWRHEGTASGAPVAPLSCKRSGRTW